MKPGCYALRASVVRCLLLLLFIGPGNALADAALGDGLRPDVRLLIDISGSMKDSDPENLRAPALDLIVRLLPEGAKAGVWSFGQDVQLLVEHRVVDAAWREAAMKAVTEIDNSGQLTNIPAALEAAMYDFDRLDPAYRTSIILLTDGKVDVSESPMTNALAARSLLADDAPFLGSAGIPVHTIALSSEADWGFLHSLAKTTGGIAEQVETAEKLTEVFYRSLEMVAPTSRVPIEGQSFEIDPSVQEFTALVFFDDSKAVAGLVSPTGRRYTSAETHAGIAWFRNRKFALVTVTAPASGKWRLVAPGAADARVTVISDLRLEVDPLPYSLPAGKRAELGLRLREGGKIVRDAEVLSVFSLSVEVENPAGVSSIYDVSGEYAVPEDGEFRVTIPGMEMPGRYKITARLRGETLERELPGHVEVLPAPGNTAISTKGDEVPESDFRAPILRFGLILLGIALLVSWFLRRRRLRKIAVWQGRNLDSGGGSGDTGTEFEAVSGMRAPIRESEANS